jgi:hypothetical protein
MAPPGSRRAAPRQESGPQNGAEAKPIVPRRGGGIDPFDPPRVPVDQVLLDLISRGDLWLLFSDALLARDLDSRAGEYQEGLDSHRGGSPFVIVPGPSLADLQRRRQEYRGIDGKPARAQTAEAIAARVRSSWRRFEREIGAEQQERRPA